MISIKNLTKKYDSKIVFNHLNLDIEENKITIILGESGVGKTTLLNVIAGLTDYDGEVRCEIKPMSYIFREDRLIPNLTVEENLKLVIPNVDVNTELEKVGLQNEAKSYPKTLSAGMSRRVSIARGMAFPSKLILMDEPLINLDLALKFDLISKIKADVKEKEKTAIIVTHDVKEAVLLADRILVLNKGEIVNEINSINENTEQELFDFMVNINK